MAGFRNRVLQVVERIYKIDGDKAPNYIETEVPVTIVHDVSRDAGISRALGKNQGYWFYKKTHTHAGADIQRGVFTPNGLLVSGFLLEPAVPDPGEWWTWHLMSGVDELSGADFNYFSVFLRVPPSQIDEGNASGNPLNIPVYACNTDNLYGSNGDATGNVLISGTYSGSPVSFLSQIPILLPGNTTITYQSSSSAAGTCDFWSFLWTGPKGVPPPGMR